MGENQTRGAASRRALLLGVAGLFPAALAACGTSGGPDAAEPATPTGTAMAGTGQATATPSSAPATASPPAVPGPPSRQQIIAEYGTREPREWGLQVSGVVSSSASGHVALTFDACGGPGGAGCDRQLLATLRKLRIPATLFVNERWIKANQALAAELAADPLFELANHGTRHLPLSVNGKPAYGIPGTASAAEVYDELMGNRQTLLDLTGKVPRFFRSGTAHYDEVATAIARRLGMAPVNFTINGDGGATYPAATVTTEISRARPGDIVISHFNKPGGGTAAGFAAGLPRLLERGITFATLDGVLPLARSL